MITNNPLDAAYTYCQQLANQHYENFPVASLLLPKRLRRPISVIYAFARTADDFADEGTDTIQTRLANLNHYSEQLRQLEQPDHQPTDPIFLALQDVIQQHQLPLALFEDLLIAFRQDVVKTRYANFDEVLDYCRYSANPVGRLLLHLNGNPSEAQLQQSDAVCSALQLINFFQDIVQDMTEQDRIYLPQDELTVFGLTEDDLIANNSQRLAPLMRSLYTRTANLMAKGVPLGASLKGRLGWEVRAMTLGGIETLHQLMSQDDTNLLSRPRLSKPQLFTLLITACVPQIFRRRSKLALIQHHDE